MKGLFTFPDGQTVPVANIDFVGPLDSQTGFTVHLKSGNQIYFSRYVQTSHTWRPWRQVQDAYNQLVTAMTEHYDCKVVHEKEVY